MATAVLFDMPKSMRALDEGTATPEQMQEAFVLIQFALRVGDWDKIEAAYFVHLRAMKRSRNV